MITLEVGKVYSYNYAHRGVIQVILLRIIPGSEWNPRSKDHVCSVKEVDGSLELLVRMGELS